jgi:hypothetical protein
MGFTLGFILEMKVASFHRTGCVQAPLFLQDPHAASLDGA